MAMSAVRERRMPISIGASTGVTRGEPTHAPLVIDGPLGALLRESFDVVASEEHTFELVPPARGEREHAAPPSVSIDVTGPAVVLVEDAETGRLRWVFRDGGPATSTRGASAAGRFTIPLDGPTPTARRGAAAAASKRIIRVLVPNAADPLLGKAGAHFARWWEESNRREGLRLVDRSNYAVEMPEEALGFQQVRRLAAGPSLMFLHGTMAQTHTGFGALPALFLDSLVQRYEGRLWAYDHFTLSRSPAENAAHLVDEIKRISRKDQHFEIDIVAHSRGGLVAREMAEAAELIDGLRVRSITFVATPNSGTPLCSPENIDTFVSQLTNFLTVVPDNPVIEALEPIVALVKHIVVAACNGLDGILAMDPADKRLAALNLGRPPTGLIMRGVGSDYEPPKGTPLHGRLRDAVFDRVMGDVPNDLLVPVESVRVGGSRELMTAENWLQLERRAAVDHSSYWRSARTMNWVRERLDATGPPLRPAGRAPSTARGASRGATRGQAMHRDGGETAMTNGTTGTADRAAFSSATGEPELGRLRVTLAYGSLEHADFPVIVGHYDDAPIRGAEGVVDMRLNGILSRRHLIGRYPRAVGESMFLMAPHGVVQYPIGAYVLGLGSTGELSKSDLSTGVMRAIVDRCLRLYQYDGVRTLTAEKAPEPIHVGVSTVLIGSSLEAGGLAVDTCVAALVEGVVRANQALLQYEQEGQRVSTPLQEVRVAELQIVERYADRCELASRALSDIEELLGADRASLLDVVATPRRLEGALPPRPPTADVMDTWSRFIVTASDAERQNRERTQALRDPAVLNREIELDVAYLGRLARVDRSLHRIDRVAVERLIEQAMELQSGEGQTAGTLYELLFPRELKREVAHSTELHLVVDEFTANYPWELLAMRTQEGERRVLSLANGLLRQFRESSHWRWSGRRAREARALVIGNPPVSTYPSLQGAADEALAVTGLLTRHDYDVRSLIWDASGNFVGLGDAPQKPETAILDALFENDYRIIHIASHGEVVNDPDRPGELLQASSGAIIGDNLVISGTTIRQLPAMPDLFFLNCCHLAKIGVNRLAAGIARELMAAGVRAVVAAGWPVSDIAAVRFAISMYEALLSGADYSIGVERGRARARDGSNTWAAYQCYGVPGFRLHAGQPPTDGVPQPPLTVDELLRRVANCTVTAGDISSPETSAMESIRRKLLTELDVLAKAVEVHDTWETPEVCEALGKAFADLASPEQGMEWYRRACTGGDRKSGHRLSSLEQLANMEARYAQQLALGRISTNTVGTPVSASLVDQLFDEAAKRLARLIDGVDVTDERLALRASLAKKHAACLPPDEPRRMELVLQAANDYEIAAGSATSPYQRLNAAQLRAVLGETVLPEIAPEPTRAQVTLLVDQQPHTESYWDRATKGDRLLTELMYTTNERQLSRIAMKMARAYQAAFGARSSWRERAQTLEHLSDLAMLLPAADPRRRQLERVGGQLAGWSGAAPTPTEVAPQERGDGDGVGGGDGDVDGSDRDGHAQVLSGPAPSVATVKATTARRAEMSMVHVEALPASYGDAILVTYGDQRVTHRMLIDAGPADAFKRGVRDRLGGEHLDLFVITHVDADHIDGAIQLLLDKRITFDDVWFNGWSHLPPAPPSRGGREGAILDALLRDKPWNLAFDKGPIVVPPDGPLPTKMIAGGARITLLSPIPMGLQRLRRTWQKALDEVKVTPGDAAEAIALLAKTDRFDEATRGGPTKTLGRDPSVPNGSSIAFLFEFGSSVSLFAGDAHAGVLADSLRRLAAERGVEKIKLDLFKLAHHGSRGNITPDVVSLLDCERFLISTDGSKFGHPDVEAIDLLEGKGAILTNYPQIADRAEIAGRARHQPLVDLRA